MPERFSAHARLRSFRYAARGVAVVLTQHNAWLHAVATCAVVGLGLFVGLPRRDWLWLVVAIAGVWTAEALNTALEQLADAAHPGQHPGIARAKDAAAAAVLIASLGAAGVGVLVLGPPLLAALVDRPHGAPG